MQNSRKQILLVEDSLPFRDFISRDLRSRPELELVGEVSDGLAAIQQAQDLQPDMVILDIGLPKLNGIEAAREIRKRSPKSRILFLTQELSADLAQAALDTGAEGYLVKMAAGRELTPALSAVLGGERFVSAVVRQHLQFPLGHLELCRTAV